MDYHFVVKRVLPRRTPPLYFAFSRVLVYVILLINNTSAAQVRQGAGALVRTWSEAVLIRSGMIVVQDERNPKLETRGGPNDRTRKV